MLKLAKRAAQAEKQAARRARIRTGAEIKNKQSEYKHRNALLNYEITHQMKQARRASREKWELGPLAPQTNHAGVIADPLRRGHGNITNQFGSEMFSSTVAPQWGSFSARRARMQAMDVFDDARVKKRCAWAGSPQMLCIAVDDRLVVVEGPYKGQIARCKELRAEDGVVKLENVGRVNVTVPEAMMPRGTPPVQQLDAEIPIDAVRLVHPLTDPVTGTTRDVVIQELQPRNIIVDRVTRDLSFSRVVPGLNVEIPWPPKEAPTYEDYPVDTLRIDSEKVTFVPTLLRPPAPEEVLDELRNKYSTFRTRHTPEYIAKKEAEAAAKEEARKYGPSLVKGTQPGLSPPGMRTPLEEFHIQQKALRRARGQPELSDEMLEKIGRIMAASKAVNLENAGISEVVPSPPEPVASS